MTAVVHRASNGAELSASCLQLPKEIRLGLSGVRGDGQQAHKPRFRMQGELQLQVVYKAFEDDEVDAGYRDGEAYAGMLQEQGISDVKSAAGEPA